MSLVLTDDDGITSINRQHLAHDYPTDVISFLYDPVPGEAPVYCADIVVNVERAAREGSARMHRPHGRRAPWGPDKELALYMAHACNHLTGEDDATPKARASMRRRELRWVATAETAGLIEGLVSS